jgi:hypothetical protein
MVSINSKSVVLILNGLAILLAMSYLAYVYLSNQPDLIRDIEVSLAVNQSEISEPSELDYTIKVRNSGNVALKDIIVSFVDPGDNTQELVDPTKSLDNNAKLNVDEVWEYVAVYKVNESELIDDVSLIASAAVRSRQTGDKIFKSEVVTQSRGAISAVKKEFMDFKDRFTKDRSNSDYEGYGRDVALTDGLRLLEDVAFRSKGEAETNWLAEQYADLFSVLIEKPGYTIRTNPEKIGNSGQPIGATGTAMELIRSAGKTNLGTDFFEIALVGISQTYRSLFVYSDQKSTRNIESWISSVDDIEEVTSTGGVQLNPQLCEARKEIYEVLRKRIARNSSEQFRVLMQGYLRTTDAGDCGLPKSSPPDIRGPSPCTAVANGTFRYKYLFGLIEYDKGKNDEEFRRVIDQFGRFCKIECIEVASTSAKARDDIRKRLRSALGRTDLAFVSNRKAHSNTRLQIYSRDSQNCRSG